MSAPITLGDLAYTLFPLVPLRAMCASARMHGRLQYLTHARERSVVRENIVAAFGDGRGAEEIDRLTRRFFEDQQLRGLLLLLTPKLKPEQIDKLFPMEGLEHLDWARSRGKGAILLGSHLHSICTFMAVEVLRDRGYDVRVALPVDRDPYAPSAFRRLLNRLTGGKTFMQLTEAFYAQFNIRPILRCLEDNVVVAMLGDGWHSAGFVEVNFLGRPVLFTTGAIGIARHTGSPVLPFFTIGEPPDKMRFVVEEPILPDPAVKPKADVERMVREYAARLEQHLLQNIPGWQHLGEPRALASMAQHLRVPLAERYEIRPGAER